MEKKSLLLNLLEKKETLIAVHRGSSTGNIIENTIPAFKAAIAQKADMIEVDVIMSTDGTFYCFHDGGEERLFEQPFDIRAVDAKTIDNLVYRNSIHKKNEQKVELLADALEYFKTQNCLINLDRCWFFLDKLVPFLDDYGLADRIIIKTPIEKESLSILASHSTKYMYMPITYTPQELLLLEAYPDLNTVGVELIAENEDAPLFSQKIIQELRDKNLFIWANALVLDDETKLFAGLDDDVSIKEAPSLGWGKLIDMGVNVIQTDWPAILYFYLETR